MRKLQSMDTPGPSSQKNGFQTKMHPPTPHLIPTVNTDRPSSVMTFHQDFPIVLSKKKKYRTLSICFLYPKLEFSNKPT